MLFEESGFFVIFFFYFFYIKFQNFALIVLNSLNISRLILLLLLFSIAPDFITLYTMLLYVTQPTGDIQEWSGCVREIYISQVVIEFSLPKKLVKLIEMCLSETYSRVRVGEFLSDAFPIHCDLKQADALSPLLFNFALEYSIRRVQKKAASWRKRLGARLPPLGSRARVSVTPCGFRGDETGSG